MEEEIKLLCKSWGFDDFNTLGELEGFIYHQPIYLDNEIHLDGVPIYVQQDGNNLKIFHDVNFHVTAHFFGDDTD